MLASTRIASLSLVCVVLLDRGSDHDILGNKSFNTRIFWCDRQGSVFVTGGVDKRIQETQ
jgi:hypothetical protein